MSFDSNLSLNSQTRTERGKNVARRLRVAGLVPITIYGGGQDAASTSVVKREFTALIRKHGRNSIFTLNVDGAGTPVKIAELQLDPIKGTLIHADLIRISLTEKSKFEVPIHIVGEPEGVRLNGGILDVVKHSLDVRCLPTEIPASIDVDVTNLNIGDHLSVSDLQLGENVEVLAAPETVIATVVAPRAEEEAAPSGDTPAEPEVVKKGKTEEGK